MSKKTALSTVILAAWMVAGAVGLGAAGLDAHSSGASVQAGCPISVTAPASGTSGGSCVLPDDGGTGNG